jgi:DNA-binding GntR family transcriptional regulator
MARTTPHDHPTADDQPLYGRVATQLLGELHDGTIPPGERLPGERQLAEHFQVSRETVDRRWRCCAGTAWSPPTGAAATPP